MSDDKKAEEQNEKANDFFKEYGELVKKHGFDFVAYPVFIPDGQGGFKIIVQQTAIDTKNQPVKSPFIPE